MGAHLMAQFYKIKIGNCERQLPLIKGDKISYYSFNMIGDVELNKEAAKEIAKLISYSDVILTIECKAIGLVEELSALLKQPKYVVIRKSKKSYMKNVVSISGNTIISGDNNYYLDGNDIEYLRGKRIVVVDDVISTGGTIGAVYKLLEKTNLTISKIACVLCEGTMTTNFRGIEVVSCGFIPLLENE